MIIVIIMMERVRLLLLLVFFLSFCYLKLGWGDGHFVAKLQGGCIAEEREALLNFKQSLYDPQLLLYDWDITEDCCTWKGVSCSNTTSYVIKLDLSRHIAGFNRTIARMKRDEWPLSATSFVPSLFHLQHLQYLCLTGINFNRTNIPQYLNLLSNLHYLDLSNMGLIGVIPSHLGNLTKLQYLDLGFNSLTASRLIWMSHLSSLQYVDFSKVDLTLATNWLHEINTLPALSTLILNECNLQTLPTLLSNSNFSSTIKTFDLSNNQFQSRLPSWISNMTNLVEMYFNYCQLQGMITNNIFGALYRLSELDLSNNFIEGSIPQQIGKLRNLTYLDLSNNSISGSIPQSFGQLTNLFVLNLAINKLNGSLSDANFKNLWQLKFLFLSNNHLDFNLINSNWVPPFQLEWLLLSSCLIGPHFPPWLQTQKFLSVLDISNGGISDIIPNWFWNMFYELEYLNISHNTIRGELPMSLNILSYQLIIDLRSNLLEGHLPQLIGVVSIALFSNNMFSKGIEWYLNANMIILEVLDVSQNHLSGEIPKSICQIPSIKLLDLSHNNLSGEIPKCPMIISSFKMIQIIRLTNNNFWGSIPPWIGNLPRLLSLHLGDNNFHGEIPFLGYCNKLSTLDLGNNKLTGNIPLWIGEKLLSLSILLLRSNKFYGSIPWNLSNLKELQILDLSNNFLSGILPKSFKYLNSMTIPNKTLKPLIPLKTRTSNAIILPESLIIDIKGVEYEFMTILSLVMLMDLSCNNFSGEIPIELMSLIGLISLNLSRNQFTGHIPFNIGAMKNLESLDLSRNNLSGEIPESIVNISGLNHLNLSYNQLSGRIPVGTQLDSFDESSYYGNFDLCGKPLRKTCKDDQHNIHIGGRNSNVDNDDDFGLFLGMGLGFTIGLWSVVGILLLKGSWATTYFQLFDNIINNIYVFIIVKMN